jgi:hypothetical protein
MTVLPGPNSTAEIACVPASALYSRANEVRAVHTVSAALHTANYLVTFVIFFDPQLALWVTSAFAVGVPCVLAAGKFARRLLRLAKPTNKHHGLIMVYGCSMRGTPCSVLLRSCPLPVQLRPEPLLVPR